MVVSVYQMLKDPMVGVDVDLVYSLMGLFVMLMQLDHAATITKKINLMPKNGDLILLPLTTKLLAAAGHIAEALRNVQTEE